MGGGISLTQEGVEDMITTTILIGRAISAISFPGMYRIYDFHSRKAPRLKNAQKFSFFIPDDEEESDEDDSPPPDPSQYEHLFKLTVGTDEIYLENAVEANEAGWTPLHTCCMSMSTASAGAALIEETIKRGESLEIRTKMGPGTFNSGWTPLQMACAYGVEPLVLKLVDAGANVNATNSFGHSCLLEACHRGFEGIVRCLVRSSKLDMAYIPSTEDTANSPFANSPAQAALGEAARCGFHKVIQVLLDAGAPRDLTNSIGWTALHEACFYNRIDAVKTLLLHGADPLIRTQMGALPFHLAALPDIREMLKNMGGPACVPKEGDRIDMMEVLAELTMPEMFSKQMGQVSIGDGKDPNPFGNQMTVRSGDEKDTDTHKKFFAETVIMPKNHVEKGEDSYNSASDIRSDVADDASQAGRVTPTTKSLRSRDNHKEDINTAPLLHSGPMLGDLPSLSSAQKVSPGKNIHRDLDTALEIENRSKSGLFSNSPTKSTPSLKADDKNRKKKKKKVAREKVPEDMPKHFICQLTQKPMSEPMRTRYGNTYDKAAIMNWMKTQGHICPLTGAPLAETDLTPNEELGIEIREWVLKKSLSGSNGSGAGARTRDQASLDQKAEQDSLYDF